MPKPPRSYRRAPYRGQRWLLGAALLALALLLLSVRYVPFQDFPNLTQLLEIDHRTTLSPYYERPTSLFFGDMLYVWLARLLTRVLSVDRALRVEFVVAALGIPLAASVLAASLEADAVLAGFLALPLSLCWPIGVGLLAYALAVPCVLLATSAALALVRSPSLSALVRLTIWSLLAYLAHPVAFAVLLVCLAAATLFCLLRRWRLVLLLTGVLPALLLLSHDLGNGAFDPRPGVDATMHFPTYYRPTAVAVAHLITRGYGIDGVPAFVLCAPFVFISVAAAYVAARRWDQRVRFLVIATVAAIVCSLAIPESHGLAFLLGSRSAALAAAFIAVLAACGLSNARRARRTIVILASLLAFGLGVGRMLGGARRVLAVVGELPPRALAGRFLPVQVTNCTESVSTALGGYDPLRHVWSYALSEEGVTPYLFAWSGYAPVWYRSDAYARHLRAPAEFLLTADEEPMSAEACLWRNRSRLRGALAWRGYAGVLVYGDPAVVAQTLLLEPRQSTTIGPGMVLIPTSTSTSLPSMIELHVDEPGPEFVSGFHEPELVDERLARWSAGQHAHIEVILKPAESLYTLAIEAKGLAGLRPTVDVRINGSSAAHIALDDGWRVITVPVPSALLREGKNTIELVHVPTRQVDRRDVAALYASFRLAPAPAAISATLASSVGRATLADGWSSPERSGKHVWAWSDAPEHATLRMILAPRGGEYRLTLTASAHALLTPLIVGVRINGVDGGSLLAQTQSAELVLPIRSGLLRNGVNDFVLSYARTIVPSHAERPSRDSRTLAIRLERVELRPSSNDP